MTTIRNPRKYGWKPQLPDARDYSLSRSGVSISSYKNLHSLVKTVWDQQQEGSCTANAITQSMMTGMTIERKAQVLLSRQFLYYNERVIEGDPTTDGGAAIRDGMKSAATDGVCTEPLWPYLAGNIFTPPPKSAYVEAPQNLIQTYLAVPQDLNDLQQCLAAGYPFVFGFSVYDSFESETVATSGNVPMPNLNAESLLGGHAVLCIGYNNGAQQKFVDGKVWPTGTFLVQNSWGTSWGMTSMAGCFSIPYAYLTDPNLASDFWTTRAVV
jgi:C1A family cysteine protease